MQVCLTKELGRQRLLGCRPFSLPSLLPSVCRAQRPPCPRLILGTSLFLALCTWLRAFSNLGLPTPPTGGRAHDLTTTLQMRKQGRKVDLSPGAPSEEATGEERHGKSCPDPCKNRDRYGANLFKKPSSFGKRFFYWRSLTQQLPHRN